MRRPTHIRRRLAIAALAVWVLGFELGPGLHIGFHDLFGHHTHAGDSGEGGGEADPDHGANSPAHRGLAASAPPPAIPIPGPALAGEVEVRVELEAAPRSRRPATTRVRGPPAA